MSDKKRGKQNSDIFSLIYKQWKFISLIILLICIRKIFGAEDIAFSEYGRLLWIIEYVILFVIIFVVYNRFKFIFINFLIVVLILLIFTQGLFVLNKIAFDVIPGHNVIFKGELYSKSWKNDARSAILEGPSGYNRQMGIFSKEIAGKGYHEKNIIGFHDEPIKNAILFDRILLNEKLEISGKENGFSIRILSLNWDIDRNNMDEYDRAKLMYMNGNIEEAFKMWKKLAESGDYRASYQIGISYLYGDGVEKSYKDAELWIKKAEKGGIIDPAIDRKFKKQV